MSCSKWIEPISMMLEGSLAGKELHELKGHLAGCARCRTEVLLQKKIDTALRAETHAALRADFTQQVAAGAAEIYKKEKAPRPWLVLVPPLAAATAAAALFFLGLDMVKENPSAIEPIAATLVKPIAWLSQAVAGLVGGAEKLESQGLPSLGRLSPRAVSFALSMLVAILPAAWSFRRIFVFMKR